MRKNKKIVALISAVFCTVMYLAGVISAFSVYAVTTIQSDKLVFASSDLQIHFLELGNVNAGDCIYIKAGENDILVDAGSNSSSLPTIKKYITEFVGEDDTIEYAIVTHAHKDHYACYAMENSLFEYFHFKTLIDFAQHKNTGNMYNKYVNNIEKEIQTDGMVHYSALDCVEETNGAQKVYELGEGITLEILDSKYYHEKSDDENNNSVCFIIKQGDNNYLFTGDLEAEGEEELVKRNELPHCVLYKAGHHGSKTSSSDELLRVITPDYVVVTCVAGSVEYTDNLDNTFPTQAFIDRVSKYTDYVYVTSLATIKLKEGSTDDYDNVSFGSMNGNIVVYSKSQEVKFEFSNNDTLLKDTQWFKEYRRCPSNWK